ncbi:MAG TPA: hypothetical protein VNS57_04095, partial [Steroidobacteraceae bacterium]|nr:hypothetical protein [Steroidobacteraceae bacterium]
SSRAPPVVPHAAHANEATIQRTFSALMRQQGSWQLHRSRVAADPHPAECAVSCDIKQIVETGLPSISNRMCRPQQPAACPDDPAQDDAGGAARAVAIEAVYRANPKHRLEPTSPRRYIAGHRKCADPISAM